MSEYVNIGCYIDGVRPKSKKAIKDALKEITTNDRRIGSITFDVTAAFGPDAGRRLHPVLQQPDEYPDGLRPGVSYQVCGPDPYTKRNFYGTITVQNGAVKCS